MIIADQVISEQDLKNVVVKAGYTVISVDCEPCRIPEDAWDKVKKFL